MKKIVFGIYIFFSMIISVFYMIILKVLKKEERFYDLFLKPCFKILLKILNTNVEVEGEIDYPLGNTLVISNHSSLMDIVLFFVYIDDPMIFVSKKENARVPVIGRWMKYHGAIFIDRENIRQSIKSLQSATKYMKENNPVMIFPQGTRDSKNINFKPGSLKFVKSSKGDILTLAIKGTDEVLKGFSYKKTQIKMNIKEILKYEDYKDENLVQVQKELESWVKERVL